MIKLPIGDFELRIGVSQDHQLVIKLPIGDFEKQQSPIQLILSPIGDFHFSSLLSCLLSCHKNAKSLSLRVGNVAFSLRIFVVVANCRR